MLRPFSYLFSLLVLVTLCSCSSPSGTDQMASALCDCMKPLAVAYSEMENLDTESSNMEDLENLMNRLESQADRTDACIDQLEEKYGEALETEQTDIETAMNDACPEVMSLLQRTGIE